MSPHTVDLHSISFRSKKEATDFFKKMLGRYQDGEELTTEDGTVLFKLLQRHPEAKDKIGVGVKAFYRARSDTHPTSCFHIQRLHGPGTDFSYASCISGKSASLDQQFNEACRYAVSEKLIAQKEHLFRESGGTMRCAKTGALITIQEADYRHTSPKLKDIIVNFLAAHRISVSSEMITHGHDMQYVVKFTDSKIEEMFKVYHANHANLAMFKKHVR